MLRFEKLRKTYGGKVVFSDLKHRFDAGCYVLRAPNGEGKSTLLRTLAGVEKFDEGRVWIAGASLETEPIRAKSRLGYIPDACAVYPFLTGRQFFELVATSKRSGLDQKVAALISSLLLEPHVDQRFDRMSLGMQKKFLCVAGFVGEPAVVIADEPDNGLDDASRGVLVEHFRSVASRSVVLFSTHDGDFADACGASLVRIPFGAREGAGP